MKIINCIIAAAGIGAAQAATAIPTPDTLAEILKIVTQIVILVVTLWGLLKKKKQE